MPLLAAALPSAPLFVAKLVRTELRAENFLADARRDLTAVGYVADYGPDWYQRRSLLVFRGRSTIALGTGSETRPTFEPVAILDKDRFVVAISRDIGRTWTYRAARPAKGGFRTEGQTLPKPKLAEPPLAPEPVKTMPYPRDLWPPERSRGVDLGPTIEAAWWRLPSGVRVGSGVTTPVNAEDGFVYTGVSVGASFVARDDGQIAPLRSVVQAPPGTRLGAILWVSHEGWLIAENGEQGLAWLYPTRS